MRFVWTVLATLACFAIVIHNADAKPLSRVESERELRVLNDLLTYLSKKEENEKSDVLPPLPPLPPQKSSPADGNSQGNEDVTPVGDLSVPDNQGPSAESDKADDVTFVIEENLQKDIKDIVENVDSLLKLIKNGLENGDVNKVYKILQYIQRFLKNLGEYNTLLRPHIKAIDETLNKILSEMKNAAEQLEKGGDGIDKAGDGYVDEETESSLASDKEEKKPSNNVVEGGEPAKSNGEKPVTGGDSLSAGSTSGEESQVTGAGGDAQPAGGEENPAGGEENPAAAAGGGQGPAGGEENPASGAGGGQSQAGGEETPASGGGQSPAGGEENPASSPGGGQSTAGDNGGEAPADGVDGAQAGKRLQTRGQIQEQEALLRLLNKLKELEA